MEAAWQFLKKLNIELSHDPAIPFLGVYPKELKTGVQTRAHTQVFTAALFTIAKMQRQRKCPSADEWMNKMGYICMCVCVQSCPTLCNPMDCSPPGFSAHGIFQARILEWVAISSFRKSQPRDQTHISCVGWITTEPPHANL